MSINWLKAADKGVKDSKIVIGKEIRKINEKLDPLQKKNLRGLGGKTIERLQLIKNVHLFKRIKVRLKILLKEFSARKQLPREVFVLESITNVRRQLYSCPRKRPDHISR